MSLLLEDLAEDLAEETWVSNLRGTDRFDEEVRELERLRAAESAIDDFLRRIDEAAHQATTYVVARVPQVEGLWQAALSALRAKPEDQGVRLLRQLVRAFQSAQRLAQSARAFWTLAVEFKIESAHLANLDTAQRRFQQLATEAQAALDQRINPKRPTDPTRLELGLQQAREGKTVKASEALARFRRTQH